MGEGYDWMMDIFDAMEEVKLPKSAYDRLQEAFNASFRWPPEPQIEGEKEVSNATSAFLRRQAERLLERAERAEAFEKLRELPLGSVIVFTRTYQGNDYSYAAVLVGPDLPTAAPRRWFLTGSYRPKIAMGDKDLVDWLVAEEVRQVKVVTDVVVLGDWNAAESDWNAAEMNA